MGRIILFLVFLLIAVATIYPFYYLVLASFRPSDQLFRKGMDFSLDPSKMTLNNYKYVFLGKGQIYFYWYRNSILITSLFTVICLFLLLW
jgi:arabinosaccharide transport system permease protein